MDIYFAKWIYSSTKGFQNFKSFHIYMKDAESAKTNEKSIFRFLVFELWSILYSKLIEKLTNFEYKTDHISKTKNRKIDFSFISAHSASFM